MRKPDRKFFDIIIPVFNGLPLVEETICALLEQQLPTKYSLTITVVDDGSQDKTASHLKKCFNGRIKIIQLIGNSGRATARNTGANSRNGGFLLFLDSDCVPANKHLVLEHIQALESGAMVSCGLIKSNNSGFWADYQHHLAATRSKNTNKKNLPLTMTSANMAVKRSYFEKAGKFNVKYKHYGFEDRDLLLRLHEQKAIISYTPTAIANHDDNITLSGVCKKMHLSGQHSSHLFAAQHLENYKSMPYYRFDARQHPWLCHIFPAISLALPFMIKAFATTLENQLIPFKIRIIFVRITSALSFLTGTCKPR